jgi:hypothetical protein
VATERRGDRGYFRAWKIDCSHSRSAPLWHRKDFRRSPHERRAPLKRINPVEPVLTLYQNHPLYGILYHQALAPATFVPETEMTFVAVPYFAGVVNENDRALVFDWRVNGKAIAQSQTNPSTLTINAANSSGVALIELVLTHATNFYMDAKGLWNITFSTSAAEGQFGAFGQQL